MCNVTDFTIRAATSADIDEILALWYSIDRHTALPDKPEYLQQFLDFAPELFLVAEVDGRIAGTIIGGWDGWRGHIARLATDPTLRRSGIAKALVREIESKLNAKGAVRIYALVDRLSPPAEPFWRAMGYVLNENVLQYSRNLGD
jgi:ribosomal protein S18 acetylase RimI-like enzyme